jgi:hypothetical protein
MKSRRGPRGLRIDKPVAIIHCTCYFGFRRNAVAEDYQRMVAVAGFFYGKSRDGRVPLQVLGIERGKPYVLSADDIATLRRLDLEGSQKALTAVHKSIKPGEAVRVSAIYKDGALVDLMGPDPEKKGPPVLMGFDGDKAQIHAWMIGAPRVMTVPAWAVERA